MQTQTFIKDMTRMNASKQLQKEKCPAFCHKSKLRLHQHSTSDTLFRQCHYLATAIYRALCGLRSNPKVSLKQVFASVKVNFSTKIRTYPWNISSLTQYLREVPPSIWNHRHNSFHTPSPCHFINHCCCCCSCVLICTSRTRHSAKKMGGLSSHLSWHQKDLSTILAECLNSRW